MVYRCYMVSNSIIEIEHSGDMLPLPQVERECMLSTTFNVLDALFDWST